MGMPPAPIRPPVLVPAPITPNIGLSPRGSTAALVDKTLEQMCKVYVGKIAPGVEDEFIRRILEVGVTVVASHTHILHKYTGVWLCKVMEACSRPCVWQA